MKIYPLTKVVLASVTFLLFIILVKKFGANNCTSDFRFSSENGWSDGLYELKLSYIDKDGVPVEFEGVWLVEDNSPVPFSPMSETQLRIIKEGNGLFALMLGAYDFSESDFNDCGEIVDSVRCLKILPLEYDDVGDDGQYRY